ncbi:MAG: hypothetical protein D6696_04720 [Acidobacteria bacterium]|nr:MAG: hypothetical protein D6696_04720 [Acidobacteriota bacterium]
MANVTRYIGLSLGADLCWPICFEEIVKRARLRIPYQGDTVELAVERVTIEPFDLQQPCRYSVVIDRLTHWYHTSREWIKKAVILNDLYVLNNPWSVQSMEKQTTYCAMMKLGLPVPRTWMVPPKAYEPHDDLQPTLERYARLFDLTEVGQKIGYPLFMKPYDGGAWRGVSRIDGPEQLRAAYEQSGRMLMHLQKAVEGWDLFVRCIGLGPQVNVVRYDPSAPLHERYRVDFFFVDAEEHQLLRDMVLTINTFFGWDFNSCEALRAGGVFHPIDFANACPDSQVTSLHYHFPWLVRAMVRWAVFCAVTGRKMRQNVDWAPYYAIAARDDLPYRDKLRAYAEIADQRLETDRFREFCATHLSHLDEVVIDFFATAEAKDAVYQKVASLYPPHEVEEFTERFWGAIQFWRKTESERLAAES